MMACMLAWLQGYLRAMHDGAGRAWAEGVRRARRWRARQRTGSIRDAVREELDLAAKGIPLIEEETLELLGSGAATAAARARATRAPRTAEAAKGLVTQMKGFLDANPRLLAADLPPEGVTGEHWDLLVEAWLLTRCEGGEVSGWTASGAEALGTAAAKAGGTVRSLADRLGYARKTAWSKSKAMSKALGAGDTEEEQHAVPIFTWEVAEGLRASPPRSVWEAAAAALVVLGSIGARRVSGATGLLVEQVSPSGATGVTVAPRHRPKQRKARVGQRRTAARPVVVDHWLVAEYVLPWLDWHRRHKSPPNAYLFPTILQGRRGVRTAMGFNAGNGFWVEPLRKWTQRAATAAVQRCTRDPGGRTFQGLRSGNNIEMSRNPEVSVITRRKIHERTLKPILGSEKAYQEVFVEDFREATRCLGRLRIERDPETGLLTVTAVSESAGANPSDWKVIEPVRFEWSSARDGTVVSDDTVSGEESGEGEGEAIGEGEVVGDGDSSTRVVSCGRCARVMLAGDYGFLCDAEGCRWAACTDCHVGGHRAPLWCPAHMVIRMKKG